MSEEANRYVEWSTACPRCGERQWYDERHDAFFCHRDDVWLEAQCDDEGCDYCRDRPTRPDYVADLP